MTLRPDPHTLHIIAAWLRRLALISAMPAGISERDMTVKFESYVDLLGALYPSGAFTQRSLAHTADGNPWFPPYDTIRVKLAEWWRDNRPPAAALTDQTAIGLDGMDLHWLNFWNRRLTEINALDDHPLAAKQKANLASLIRAMSPKAWAVISGVPIYEAAEPTEWQLMAVRKTVAALHSDDAPREPRAKPRDVSLNAEHLAAAREQANRQLGVA